MRRAEVLEHGIQSFPARYRDDRVFHRFQVHIFHNGFPEFPREVFYLYFFKGSVALYGIQNLPRHQGVDADKQSSRFFPDDQVFSQQFEFHAQFFDFVVVFLGQSVFHQMDLRAVSDFLFLFGFRILFVFFRQFHRVSVHRFLETADHFHKARSAAVQNADFLQYRQQIRSAFQRLLGFLHQNLKEFLYRRFGILFDHFIRGGAGFAHDGQDGSFDRFHDRPVGDFRTAHKRRGEIFRGDFDFLIRRLRKAAEHLGKDHSRVSSGSHQQSAGEHLGDIAEGFGFHFLDLFPPGSKRQVRAMHAWRRDSVFRSFFS